LKRFLSVIVQMGNTAEAEMSSIDEALIEARNAEDEKEADASDEG